MSDQKLYEALKTGDLSTVKSLVPSVFSVDPGGLSVAFENGMTNLMVAIKYGHLNIVKYLLDEGANIEDTKRSIYWKGLDPVFPSWSPLMVAIYYNQPEIAKYLIDRKADVNHTNWDRDTPLIMAAKISNYEIIKHLVENGAYVHGPWGSLALMEATIRGNLDIVKYLVENGANIDLQDSRGRTALSIAISNGKLEIVKYLIQKENSEKGILSYIFTLDKPQTKPNRFNLRYERGNTLLITAVERHQPEILQFLLEDIPQTIKSQYVNAENKYGYTALMMAAKEGKLDTLEILLNHGVSINHQNEFGNTALIYASKNDQGEAIKYLLEHRADATIRGQDGKTAYDSGNDQIKLIFVEFYENRINELRKDQQTYFSVIPKDLSDLIKSDIITQL